MRSRIATRIPCHKTEMPSMKIRVGFEFAYEFVAPTPMVLMLNVHPSRATDLIRPDQLRITPTLPMTRYADAFGNICTRLVAPKGELQISTDAVVADSGAARGQPLLRDGAADE